jgi:DNA (cytosine-5)-methyltransferase 1
MRFKQSGGRTSTYARLHPDRPSYTVNTYFRRPNVGSNFHYAQDRLITAREAMRLQALPDSMSLVYKRQDERNALIGNAVPSLLAEGVAWQLMRSLRKNR